MLNLFPLWSSDHEHKDTVYDLMIMMRSVKYVVNVLIFMLN